MRAVKRSFQKKELIDLLFKENTQKQFSFIKPSHDIATQSKVIDFKRVEIEKLQIKILKYQNEIRDHENSLEQDLMNLILISDGKYSVKMS